LTAKQSNNNNQSSTIVPRLKNIIYSLPYIQVIVDITQPTVPATKTLRNGQLLSRCGFVLNITPPSLSQLLMTGG